MSGVTAKIVWFRPAMVFWSFGLRLGRVRYHCNARQRFLMLVVSLALREDDVCEDSVTHDKR
jgi:hypothetical protein